MLLLHSTGGWIVGLMACITTCAREELHLLGRRSGINYRMGHRRVWSRRRGRGISVDGGSTCGSGNTCCGRSDGTGDGGGGGAGCCGGGGGGHNVSTGSVWITTVSSGTGITCGYDTSRILVNNTNSRCGEEPTLHPAWMGSHVSSTVSPSLVQIFVIVVALLI